MLEIIDDQFMVLSGCLMIIADDYASGLDYSLSEKDAFEREKEIREPIAEPQGEAKSLLITATWTTSFPRALAPAVASNLRDCGTTV